MAQSFLNGIFGQVDVKSPKVEVHVNPLSIEIPCDPSDPFGPLDIAALRRAGGLPPPSLKGHIRIIGSENFPFYSIGVKVVGTATVDLSALEDEGEEGRRYLRENGTTFTNEIYSSEVEVLWPRRSSTGMKTALSSQLPFNLSLPAFKLFPTLNLPGAGSIKWKVVGVVVLNRPPPSSTSSPSSTLNNVNGETQNTSSPQLRSVSPTYASYEADDASSIAGPSSVTSPSSPLLQRSKSLANPRGSTSSNNLSVKFDTAAKEMMHAISKAPSEKPKEIITAEREIMIRRVVADESQIELTLINGSSGKGEFTYELFCANPIVVGPTWKLLDVGVRIFPQPLIVDRVRSVSCKIVTSPGTSNFLEDLSKSKNLSSFLNPGYKVTDLGFPEPLAKYLKKFNRRNLEMTTSASPETVEISRGQTELEKEISFGVPIAEDLPPTIETDNVKVRHYIRFTVEYITVEDPFHDDEIEAADIPFLDEEPANTPANPFAELGFRKTPGGGDGAGLGIASGSGSAGGAHSPVVKKKKFKRRATVDVPVLLLQGKSEVSSAWVNRVG
ncbi:hypothetical protein HDU76_004101 [Blyttiomyces sp. JEL0837]|nr:hypothetical protein HDU76_004101 [Blyttiomyces sp. JEL0837]